MKITIVQSILHWENINLNLEMFEEKIDKVDGSDLIVLPEMFTTGFSMNSKSLAERMNGKTVDWMQRIAKNKNSVITGSIIVEDDNKFFNRLIWVDPSGNLEYYDKKHLFSMANEHLHYSPGSEKKVMILNGWKIRPFICYDLRFPIWNRNDSDYDLALYVANWPQKRSSHWRSLLTARAIENQCYVVAVNRVGTDEKGLYYCGDSSVIDPTGKTIYQESDKEDIFSYELDKRYLNKIREDLPFLKDRDC